MAPQTRWLLDVTADPGSKASRGKFVHRSPDPTKDDWIHDGRWEVIDGKLAITEFTVRPAHEAAPTAGITPEALRRINLGGVIKGVRRWRLGFDDFGRTRLESSKPLPASEVPATHTRGRPITRTDDYFRLVAELWLRALRDPEVRRTRGRVRELLEDYGVKVSEKTVAEHATEARKRGFLTPGQKGTAHSSPGPKLVEYWEARKDPKGP